MGATKKFRNVQAGSRVAFVVDIVDTSQGWHPIYLEIRGTAEALPMPGRRPTGSRREVIKIHPDWVRSFNLPTPIGAVVIRLVFLLRRQAGLSLDEFHDRWRLDHGPLVASHQTRLGILRYTQSHRLDDPHERRDGRGARRHGGALRRRRRAVVGVRGAARRAPAHRRRPAGRRRAAGRRGRVHRPPGVARCGWPTSTRRSTRRPSTSSPGRRAAIVKLHFPLRHRAELSLDEAQRYWRIQHGPLIRSMAPAIGMLRYQQVHRFESPARGRAARGPRHGHRGRTPATPRRGSTADRPAGSPRPPRPGAGPSRTRRTFIDLAPLGDLDRQGARLRRPHLTRRRSFASARTTHTGRSG